ncbi:MAG TPA: TlpA disulfide reductase family protein [Solirubrobacteraceae bacterium]|jgi:thiol-disulfide isomerase/thioredoxin
MDLKRLGATLAAAALLLALAVGLTQLPGRARTTAPLSALSRAQMQAGLAGSPAALAALHAQAGLLLDGGATVFDSRLRSLRGLPAVVNKWASWCQPCRAEFRAFQHASVDLGRRVAFLGIDSGEADRPEALAFLRALPVGYPSYYDPSGHLGTQVTDSSFMPVTVFYDRRGRQNYIHQGPYLDLALLERDIRQYALGA